MAVSKAQQKAQNRWIAKAYDRVNLTLPKGQKEVVQVHATAHGESVNGFIGRAIAEAMERDSGGKGVAECYPLDGVAPGAGRKETGTAPAGRVVYRVPAEDTAGKPQEAAETSAGAGVVSLPPDTLKAAQEAAEYSMETVPEFLNRAVTAQAQRDQGPTDMIFLPKGVVKDAFCGGFAFGESARAFIIRAIHELVEKEKPMWDDEVYQLKTLEELALEGGIISLPFGALDLMDMGAIPEGGKRPAKLQRTADTLRDKFLKKG